MICVILFRFHKYNWFAFKVGIVGNNCIVIAAEKFFENQNIICSLDGKITVAWSGKPNIKINIIVNLIVCQSDTNRY